MAFMLEVGSEKPCCAPGWTWTSPASGSTSISRYRPPWQHFWM